MDTVAIILLCLAVTIVVVGLIFLTYKNKQIEGKEQEWKKAHQEEIGEREQRIRNLNEKYEALLACAEEQEKNLQTCLDGNVDEVVREKLASIDKLKKEIKMLKDEIEENEEELDDYKKRLKKKDNEKEELQEQLHKETKEHKQTQEILQNAEMELKDKVDELELKKESISFVQEVISAPPVSEANIKELYRNVDKVCEFVSGELKDVVKGLLQEEREDVFDTGVKKWAAATKKEWINGKTAIAFVGEFSAGKTSIVNRILSQDNPDVPKLPVSTKATTAIATYISGGPSTLYNFITPNNIRKNISEDTFKRVSKEVLDQVNGVSSLIQYFVMTYKNANLDNLSILDTPGFSSNDKEDAQRTINVINECDALFWVFDVNAGTVNKSSIKLIKENLKKPLYVIINKVDTKAKSEVDKVQQLIEKTLMENGVKVERFIRFSAKAPLKDIMEPIRSVIPDKAQDSYIEELSDFVNKLTKQLDNEVKKLKKEHNRLEKEGEELINSYGKSIDLLKEACDDAAGIPQLEKYLLRKDRYEMSKEEYKELCELLSTICDDRVSELKKLYSDQMETQRKAQKAYSAYMDERSKWQKMDDCKKQLNKSLEPFRTYLKNDTTKLI